MTQREKAAGDSVVFTDAGAAIEAVYAQTDWSRSPLGTPQSWPPQLRMLADVVLASEAPMFVAWGDDFALIYNQAYAPILGARHPAALGQPFAKVWPEIWEEAKANIDYVLAGQTCSFTNRAYIVQRNGRDERAWFTLSFSPVFGPTGAVEGALCVVRETTAEVLAEQARNTEIQRLRSTFDNAPGMLVVLRGPDHIFEVTNKAYRDFMGRNDFIGKSVKEALPELCEQGYLDLLDSVYRDGKPYKAQAMPVKLKSPHDGTEEEFFFDFIYQPIKEADGRVSGIFAEGIDVTAAFTAAAALREGERRYRGLMDVVPMLVWIGRNDHNLAYCNRRWYDYTGLQPNQTWDRGWDRVAHPEHLDRLMQAWDEGKARGAAWRVNVPLRRGTDGQYRWHMVQAMPVRDDAGNISEWMGIAVDSLDVDTEIQMAGAFNSISPVSTH